MSTEVAEQIPASDVGGEAAMPTPMDAYNVPDDQLDDYIASLHSQVDPADLAGDASQAAALEDADGSGDNEEGEEPSDTPEEDLDAESNDANEPADLSAAEQQLADILEPFKANGRMVKVDNVEDARRLMSMGAGYSEKMQALKPHLKTIRVLEKNQLLNDGVLNTLIDARNGNVDAIRKLIADAKIDPTDLLDIDPDNPAAYSPKNHGISDTQYEFETVLDELKESAHYTTTLDVIEGWDERSKTQMYENPAILKGLHNLVASEHFEKVQTQLSTLRTLGKVPAGMTDVDAFGMAAQMLAERGELGSASPKQESNQPKPSKSIDEQRKRAAPARGKTTAAPAKRATLDPLALSDEEFTKAYDAGLFKTISQ